MRPAVVAWAAEGTTLVLTLDRPVAGYDELRLRERDSGAVVVLPTTRSGPTALRVDLDGHEGLTRSGSWDASVSTEAGRTRLRVDAALTVPVVCLVAGRHVATARTVRGNLTLRGRPARPELWVDATRVDEAGMLRLEGRLVAGEAPAGTTHLVRLTGVDAREHVEPAGGALVRAPGGTDRYAVVLPLDEIRDALGGDAVLRVDVVALLPAQPTLVASIADGGPWRDLVRVRFAGSAERPELEVERDGTRWTLVDPPGDAGHAVMLQVSRGGPRVRALAAHSGTDDLAIDLDGPAGGAIVVRADSWGREIALPVEANRAVLAPALLSDGYLREPGVFPVYRTVPGDPWRRRIAGPVALEPWPDGWRVPAVHYDVGRITLAARPYLNRWGHLSVAVTPALTVQVVRADVRARRATLVLRADSPTLLRATSRVGAVALTTAGGVAVDATVVGATAAEGRVDLVLRVRPPRGDRDAFAGDLVRGVAVALTIDGEPRLTQAAAESRVVVTTTGGRVDRRLRASHLASAVRARANRALYRAFRRVVPVGRAVVSSSFLGRSFADTPRALEQHRQDSGERRRSYWVRDGFATTPQGWRGVRVVHEGTLRYYWALARARCFVSNTNFADEVVKRPGQVHVQTWHGTPLKRIGSDVAEDAPGVALQSNDRLARRVARWDVLVSPSSYYSTIMSRAYATTATVVEQGYPRNDLVARVRDDDALAAAAASRASVDRARTTVLYAPTWRDVKGRAAQSANRVPFSAERLAARFPDVDVLVRAHYLATSALAATLVAPNVRDVSWVEDPADLLATADVLVTDYSSVFFDVLPRGVPTIFLAYDLDLYEERTRGFYWDFRRFAPGPVVRDEAGFLDALARALDGSLAREYADRVEQARAQFSRLDDGAASRRTWDAITEGWGV